MLARIATLSQFPEFSKWMFAADHVHDQKADRVPYNPRFFTPAEYRSLDVLCELIIPADETPGAHQAGVSEFIDFIVSADDELQYPFRTGLAWLDAFSTERHGGVFAELAPTQQESLLSELAERDQISQAETEGREFFSLARKYTVIGYYTSRISLEELDYPGLQFYSSSPECRHKDDPEHKHLPQPR